MSRFCKNLIINFRFKEGDVKKMYFLLFFNLAALCVGEEVQRTRLYLASLRETIWDESNYITFKRILARIWKFKTD